MSPATTEGEDPAEQGSQPSPWLEPWQKPFFILFLLVWALNLVLLCLSVSPEAARRAEGWLLLTATFCTVLRLARRLPLQSVITATLLTGFIAGTITTVATFSGIPFGPRVYADHLGIKLFEVLPWPVPLIWIVAIFAGRGVARLVLRPWRRSNYYGYWVISLTCALILTMDLALEPFAAEIRNYWTWQTPKDVLAWYTAPWVNFLGWFVTTLAILAFTSPWLINKRPVRQPRDYHPLFLWLLLNGWLITANALHDLWLAAGLALALNLGAAALAVRGARW